MESSVAAATSTPAPAPPRPRLLLWGSHWGSLAVVWIVTFALVIGLAFTRVLPSEFGALFGLIPTGIMWTWSYRRHKLGYPILLADLSTSGKIWFVVAAVLGVTLTGFLLFALFIASVVFHWGH